MGRLIFIFLVIMFAKFIKKMMEAAAQSQSSPEVAESSGEDVDTFLKSDDFLEDFKRGSTPVYAREGHFPASIADVLETELETGEQVLKIESSFEEFQQRAQLLEKQAPEQKQSVPKIDMFLQPEKSGYVDFSADKIQSAFVMKEILSPPAAFRRHDEDCFFLT